MKSYFLIRAYYLSFRILIWEAVNDPGCVFSTATYTFSIIESCQRSKVFSSILIFPILSIIFLDGINPISRYIRYGDWMCSLGCFWKSCLLLHFNLPFWICCFLALDLTLDSLYETAFWLTYKWITLHLSWSANELISELTVFLSITPYQYQRWLAGSCWRCWWCKGPKVLLGKRIRCSGLEFKINVRAFWSLCNR